MTPRDRPVAVDRRLFGFAVGVWLASVVALRLAPVRAWLAAAVALVTAGLIVAVHQARQRPVGQRRAGRRVGQRREGQHRTGRRAGQHRTGRRAGQRRAERRAGLDRATPGRDHRIPRRPAHGARYRARHRRAVAVWVVAGALLGVAGGFAATAARTSARDDPGLRAILAERPTARVTLVVDGDPRRLRSSSTLLVPARLTELSVIDGPVARLAVRALVFARDPAWLALLPSQVVMAEGRLGPPDRADLTAAVFFATGPPQAIGDPQWSQVAAGELRAGLRQASAPLPPQAGALVPALSIGDTSGLDPVLEEEFRATGLTHLMAVSGANITLVVGFVLLLVRWLRAGPWVAAMLAAGALVGFVILVRPSPSVVRAAVMGGVGLLALLVGRSRVASSALAAAAIAALLVDPALAVDPGFWLSVLATAALILFAPRWRDRLRAAGVPSGLAEALAVSAAAQVLCAPVIAGLSGQVSLVSLPANLLAAPAVAPVTVLGVAAAAVSPWSPDVAGGLVWLAQWPARWLVLVAHVGSGAPAAALSWAGGVPGAISLAALIGGVWLGLRHPASRRVVVALVLAAILGTLPVRWLVGRWPPTGTVVVACDVGQGDAIVLLDRDGSAVVVDTGPEPGPADACLRRLGVTAIDLIVLSHFHADHIDGLTGVLSGRSVGAVLVPAFDEPAVGSARVRAIAPAPVRTVGAGWEYDDGAVALRVLGPSRPMTGTRSDPNNNSLVLLARVSGVTILLLGDAEVEQQRALLRDLGPDALRADVLKVAHHGSSYQDDALIAATGARVALVSVGEQNPYGHPHSALLDRLAGAGMRVLRTDRQGDLAVLWTGDGIAVAAGQPPGRRLTRRRGSARMIARSVCRRLIMDRGRPGRPAPTIPVKAAFAQVKGPISGSVGRPSESLQITA